MTYAKRRQMIYEQWSIVWGCIPPSEWGDWKNGDNEKGGLVAQISKSLRIEKNSYNCTRRVMMEAYMCHLDGKIFDPNRRQRNNVTQYAIPKGSIYEIMCCTLLEEGNPTSLVADLIPGRNLSSFLSVR